MGSRFTLPASSTASALMRQTDPSGPDRLTIVCTNSLELGIDIGRVEKVGQVDATYSVAALRQRIGRSGRLEGAPISGIIYSVEKILEKEAHPLDALRLRTFQAAATVSLALEGAFESPTLADLHLSTLVHQVLSLLRQMGSVETGAAYDLLVKTGPWDERTITPKFFERFLQSLAERRYARLTWNSENQNWVLSEDESKNQPVYAVFSTPAEYAVMCGGQVVGQLPMTVTYHYGDTFVLNGSRWRVLSVSAEMRRLIVSSAPSAGAPRFGGSAQAPSGLVVQRMRALYDGTAPVLGQLNTDAHQCIQEGRAAFAGYRLDRASMVKFGHDVIVFPWRGARLVQTLLLAMRREGLRAATSSFAVTVEDISPEEIRECLERVARRPMPDLDELAREARQLGSDRYDRELSPYHQRLAFARRFLDGEGFLDLVTTLLAADTMDGGAFSMPKTVKVAPRRRNSSSVSESEVLT